MLRIFSSKYIVAALATMAMTYNSSNDGVHAYVDDYVAAVVDNATGNAEAMKEQALSNADKAVEYAEGQANAAVAYAEDQADKWSGFYKENNETEIPDDVGAPDEAMDQSTAASLLMSSMVGIAAVTTAFVAIA